MRAYRRGGQSYHAPDKDLEPQIPEDAGTSQCAVALWEFFWQGYRYSESIANDKLAAAAATSDSERTPKLSPPEYYRGDRDQFADFIAQLHLVFNSDPQAFRKDQAKISYAGSYMRGAAKRWFNPHIDKKNGRIAFDSWKVFVQKFRSAFLDPDALATAERKIQELRQGSDPCAAYHAQFVSYMAILGWDEKSKIATFKRGLRSEVKDLLVGRDIPTDFEEFVSLCIKLDNSWRERQQDKKGSNLVRVQTSSNSNSGNSGNSGNSLTPTSVGTHSGPMDISAGRRGPLTKRERDHRIANNLCMYCGKSGHFASTGPESKKKGKQQASVAATTPSTSTPPAAAPAVAPNASVLYSVTPESKN
jgi:hypothetical protein